MTPIDAQAKEKIMVRNSSWPKTVMGVIWIVLIAGRDSNPEATGLLPFLRST